MKNFMIAIKWLLLIYIAFELIFSIIYLVNIFIQISNDLIIWEIASNLIERTIIKLTLLFSSLLLIVRGLKKINWLNYALAIFALFLIPKSTSLINADKDVVSTSFEIVTKPFE